MFKFNKILAPLAVAIALAFAPTAFADKDHHRGKSEMKRLLKQLDLSETQIQDVRQLMKQGHEDKNVYRQDMREISTQLTALIQNTTWDQQAVENAIMQRVSLLTQIGWQKASKKHQVWQLLTPEQQSEFVQLTEQRGSKEGKRDKSSKFLEKLDLNDNQIAEIDKIKADLESQTSNFKAQHQAFRQAQQALIQTASLNENDWQALAVKYQGDFKAMAIARAQSRHNIWNVLNTEQQTKLMEKTQHRSHKRKGRDNDQI